MREVSKEELTRIMGNYAKKYGSNIDEWSAMVLHEIDQSFLSVDQSLHRSIEAVQKAVSTIRDNQKTIQFHGTREAFHFGLGITLPVSVVCALVSILIFWFVYRDEKFQRIQRLVDTYKNAPDYALLMQNGEILERDGTKFLVLKPIPKMGDVFIGREYIYDQKNKQVLVPLGRK